LERLGEVSLVQRAPSVWTARLISVLESVANGFAVIGDPGSRGPRVSQRGTRAAASDDRGELREVNRVHHWICRSAFWGRTIANEFLPWALQGVDPGPDVLEIGPGYGVATEVLRSRVTRLTCVELDGDLARALARRTAGTSVQVIQANAVRLPFPDHCFSGAVCFTMLHHISTEAQQDLLLAEVARVLRPGGTFVGTDNYRGFLFKLVHVGDTLTPIDPQGLPHRLRSAGFSEATVDLRGTVFRFRTRRA
jgi:SAM-dependent methyltransferase